jgi:hypothetical protein
MSGFKRLKSELFEGGEKELRPVIQRVRAIAASPVEREFDNKWALDLKNRVLEGQAITFVWAVADMPDAGGFRTLRVNGQHSSWCLDELLKEEKLPSGLAIHLDTYSVADEAGAVQLFRQFDARKSARSKEDISGAYQCFQEALRECSRSVLKTAVEGLTWFRREVQELPVKSGDDIYTLFDEKRLHPFFLMSDHVLANGKSNELKRVPIMAAAYGTWLDDAKQATEFWQYVAAGTNRVEEDAATDLDVEILRIREVKEKVSAGEMYAKCHKAWHAYNNGVRVTNFKIKMKGKRLPVLGEMGSEAGSEAAA